jgi:hypothetical protein
MIEIIIYLHCKWGITRWQWNYNKIQHANIYISYKITHHAQTKPNTQSYTNNIRHITHNEYNGKKGKKEKKYRYPCNRPWRPIGL